MYEASQKSNKKKKCFIWNGFCGLNIDGNIEKCVWIEYEKDIDHNVKGKVSSFTKNERGKFPLSCQDKDAPKQCLCRNRENNNK